MAHSSTVKPRAPETPYSRRGTKALQSSAVLFKSLGAVGTLPVSVPSPGSLKAISLWPEGRPGWSMMEPTWKEAPHSGQYSSWLKAPGLFAEIDRSRPGPDGAICGERGPGTRFGPPPAQLGAHGTGSGDCPRAAFGWPATTAASATPIHHFAIFASPNI